MPTHIQKIFEPICAEWAAMMPTHVPNILKVKHGLKKCPSLNPYMLNGLQSCSHMSPISSKSDIWVEKMIFLFDMVNSVALGEPRVMCSMSLDGIHDAYLFMPYVPDILEVKHGLKKCPSLNPYIMNGLQ